MRRRLGDGRRYVDEPAALALDGLGDAGLAGKPRRTGSARSTGLAVFCSTARTSAGPRDGLAWSSSAAAPAACGAAMDVPDSVAYPRFSSG